VPQGANCFVIRSKDSGATWQRVGDGLSDQVKKFAPAVALDAGQPDHVYVAYRDGGIYASEDGGEEWQRLEVEVADPQDMKIVQV
jgi:photosystem II stability/assembly factor-like uncharacterized protein